jgi:hypothetical protein
MATRYVFGCLALLFLVSGLARTARDGRVGPAARTWLLIGLIFGLVDTWLWISKNG